MLGKPLVEASAADIVCVAFDFEPDRGATVGDVGAAVKERLAFMVEFGASGLEVDGAGLGDDIEPGFATFGRDGLRCFGGSRLLAGSSLAENGRTATAATTPTTSRTTRGYRRSTRP